MQRLIPIYVSDLRTLDTFLKVYKYGYCKMYLISFQLTDNSRYLTARDTGDLDVVPE